MEGEREPFSRRVPSPPPNLPPLPPKTFDFIESPLSILLDKRAFLRMGEGSFVIFWNKKREKE